MGNMNFAIDNYLDVVNLYIEEWTCSSTSTMLLETGKGCFIWDSVKDGERGGGRFYTKEMVSNHFSGEICDGLEKMIDEANHERELVVALIFGDKIQGLLLGKLGVEAEGTVSPSLDGQEKTMPRGGILTHNPKLLKYEEPEPISAEAILQINRDTVQYLLEHGEDLALYTGKHANALCQKVFNYLRGRLMLLIGQFNTKMLFRAYRERELVEAFLTKNWLKIHRETNESTEKLIEQDYQNMVNLFKQVQALQILITMYLKAKPTGTEDVTDAQWTAIKAIAVILVEVSVISDLLYYNLAEISLTVTKDQIRLNDSRQGFAVEQYLRKESELRVLAKFDLDKYLDSEESQSVEPETDIPDLPKPLVGVNNAFVEELGFSLEDLVQMLYNLGRIPHSSEYGFPLVIVGEENLLRNLKQDFFRNQTPDQIRAMLHFVTLGFDSYEEVTDIIPSRLLRLKDRLTLCPLVRITQDQLMFGNQMCLAACNLWLSYVCRGDIPFYESSNPKIQQAIKQLHKFLDDKHQERIDTLACRILGPDNVVDKVKKFKRLAPSLPQWPSCGEIDVLAVNKNTKTVFVMDAKNRNRKIRPADIARDLEDFFQGNESYLFHLTEKWKFIQYNLPVILSHFGIKVVAGWKVKKAFVVPLNYAFLHDTRNEVDIIIADELEDYLISS